METSFAPPPNVTMDVLLIQQESVASDSFDNSDR